MVMMEGRAQPASRIKAFELRRSLNIASVAFALMLTLLAVAHAQLLQVEHGFEFGGLPQLVRLKGVEAPFIRGVRIYTDANILRPGRYDPVGSHNESNPKVTRKVERSNGAEVVVMESVGQLKDAQKQPCGLSYRFTYSTSTDGASLLIDASVYAERDFDAMHGFLALVFPFDGATEWFALTASGWLFCDITKSGRVFQTSQTPMTEEWIIGVANFHSGYGIVIRLLQCVPRDSVDNVIIHTNVGGSGGIFIAWCDGITSRPMRSGESWRVRLVLQFMPLAEFERMIETREVGMSSPAG